MKPWSVRSMILCCGMLICGWMVTVVDAQTQTPRQRKGARQNGTARASESSKSSKQTHGQKEALPTIALVGATIHTLGPEGVLEEGAVLVRGKKIVGLRKRGERIPKGVRQIDVSGTVITPGLIDVRSELWLTEAAADSSASDASLNVVDGIDGFAEDWEEVVRQGVTAVYVQPSRRGTLGGYGALLSVPPDEQLHGPEVLRGHAALQGSLGVGASTNRTRLQQYERTKKVLDAAAEYQKEWDEYNEYVQKKKKEAAERDKKTDKSKQEAGSGKGSGEAKSTGKPAGSGGPGAGRRPGPGRGGTPVRRPTGRPRPGTVSSSATPGASAGESQETPKESADKQEEKPPKKPEKEPAKERLVQVLKGKIPLRLEIHTADDVHYALKLVEEFEELQLVFEGVSDLRSASASLTELSLPLVLGPWLSAEPLYRAEPANGSSWQQSWVAYPGAFAIGTFGAGPRSSRLLRAHMGRAIAEGFPADRVLRAVTLDAARIVGASQLLGSLEAGKRADLVCFQGDPTDAATPVALVMVAGEVVFRQPVTSKRSGVVETKLPKVESLPSRFALKTTRCLLASGTVKPRMVLIRDGKIEAMVAGKANVSAEIQVIDVGDALVTPGLCTTHATLGLGRWIEPRSQADAAYVVAADGASSGFEGEQALVRSGVLRALLAPGGSNPVAGAASLIRLGANSMVAERTAALKFVLTSESRSTERFPSSLAGQLRLIQQSLAGDLLEARVYLPEAVQQRLTAQRSHVFEAVGSGKQWVLLDVDTDAEIRAALDLVERYDLKAALLGPRQLEPFLGRLKALDVAVISSSARYADYRWVAEDLAAASQAGIRIYFAGENAEQLRLTAALAVEAGMSPQDALTGLCLSQKEFGKAQALQAGAAADIVVWSQSPVHLGANPLLILVDGQVVETGLSKEDDPR